MKRIFSAALCGAAFSMLTLSLARADVEYETKIVVEDETLRSFLEQASQLIALQDKHPDVEAALRQRAREDLKRLKSVLDGRAYYDAALSFTVDPDKHPDHYTVTVTIDPGPVYRFGTVAIKLPEGGNPPVVADTTPEALGIMPDAPALSQIVVDAQTKLQQDYANAGWPYAKANDRHVVIDTATKTMDVTYTLVPGQRAVYGPVAIEGLTRLNSRYVQRRIAWQKGQNYDFRQNEKTRQALVTSGLFSSVTVGPDGPVQPNGAVPMRISLVERSLHTIGAGGSYDTSLGLEANVTWEHRNLFGNAEDVLVTAKGGASDSGLSVKYTDPDVLWYRHDFVASISAENQLVDAFRSLSETAQFGFQYSIDPGVTMGYSIKAEHARVDEKIDYRVYTLVGLPLFVRQDASDDLLNPTKGYRAGLEVTPYLTPLGSDLTYAQARLTGSYYQALGTGNRYILAVQGILGASCCTSLDSIPKDHRLYAGGGSSVRGFAYQDAGPFDSYGNPIGGRSLTVASIELRAKVWESFQLVPFLDVGSDSAKPLPSFTGKFYEGAGIGLRYLTSVGPLRLDIATPVNPRPNIDSPIQLYISLGQAF